MPKPETIRSMLAEGRSHLSRGRVREIADLVLAEPEKACRLIECLWDQNPGVASRAADALERVSCRLPSILESWKSPLLGLLAETVQNKPRWNLALIIPRLTLTLTESNRAAAILRGWLEDPSSVVKTCALQGLADLTRQNFSLRNEVVDLLRIHSRSGTPAMRARGRILLQRFEARDTRNDFAG